MPWAGVGRRGLKLRLRSSRSRGTAGERRGMQVHLFRPLTLRGVTFPNRIVVSPMCQYSSPEGVAQTWHLVHLGSRAVGGAGLVFTEAAAVSTEGRISPEDLGIWNEAQAEALRPIVAFIRSQGSVAGIQLAHAGRKASTWSPFSGKHGEVPVAQGGWEAVGPTGEPFSDHYPKPRELSKDDLNRIEADFVAAAHRAHSIGFQVAEVHAAHGYLLHEFLSPLSNTRDDEFGGSVENRMRFPLQVVKAVRAAWPAELPLFVRISATDWVEGGWSDEDSVTLARHLKALGVDVVDCSSGGNVPKAEIPTGPGYQVPLAARVRREAGVATAAVGLITRAEQAEQILTDGSSDLVFLARELLRDPYWPRRAAVELGAEVAWPPQYERAAPAKK